MVEIPLYVLIWWDGDAGGPRVQTVDGGIGKHPGTHLYIRTS